MCLSKTPRCADAGQPVAGSGLGRRRRLGHGLCPGSRLHPSVLHESVPPLPREPAGLHGNAAVLGTSAPSPSSAPSGHQRPLLAPRLPRGPRLSLHRGPRGWIQAHGPGGFAHESQRARQHPLLAYMTTALPAFHYALTEPMHITFLTHRQSQVYAPDFKYDSDISSKHLYKPVWRLFFNPMEKPKKKNQKRKTLERHFMNI